MHTYALALPLIGSLIRLASAQNIPAYGSTGFAPAAYNTSVEYFCACPTTLTCCSNIYFELFGES